MGGIGGAIGGIGSAVGGLAQGLASLPSTMLGGLSQGLSGPTRGAVKGIQLPYKPQGPIRRPSSYPFHNRRSGAEYAKNYMNNTASKFVTGKAGKSFVEGLPSNIQGKMSLAPPKIQLPGQAKSPAQMPQLSTKPVPRQSLDRPRAAVDLAPQPMRPGNVGQPNPLPRTTLPQPQIATPPQLSVPRAPQLSPATTVPSIPQALANKPIPAPGINLNQMSVPSVSQSLAGKPHLPGTGPITMTQPTNLQAPKFNPLSTHTNRLGQPANSAIHIDSGATPMFGNTKPVSKPPVQPPAQPQQQQQTQEGPPAYTVGDLAKKYEIGHLYKKPLNQQAGFISRGGSWGDPGGNSYGPYQLALKVGNVHNFVKKSPFGEHFKGLKPGSRSFDAKWKQVANQDPEGFMEAQYNFIENQWFNKAKKKANKYNIPTDNHTVNQVLFSISNQHGGHAKIFKRAAIKSGDSPETIINKLYDSRARYIRGLSSLSPKLKRNLIRQRTVNERRDALKLLGV